jgi:hypothetical protein
MEDAGPVYVLADDLAAVVDVEHLGAGGSGVVDPDESAVRLAQEAAEAERADAVRPVTQVRAEVVVQADDLPRLLILVALVPIDPGTSMRVNLPFGCSR